MLSSKEALVPALAAARARACVASMLAPNSKQVPPVPGPPRIFSGCAALAAAALVEDDAGVITMQHVVSAVRREYQKLGKVLSPDELAYPDASREAVAS